MLRPLLRVADRKSGATRLGRGRRMSNLPILCDQRGVDHCCGVLTCLTAGVWTIDPYDQALGVFEGTRWHMHSEPVCADPDCVTYLTRAQMATMRGRP